MPILEDIQPALEQLAAVAPSAADVLTDALTKLAAEVDRLAEAAAAKK